jgi:hypothetical protein
VLWLVSPARQIRCPLLKIWCRAPTPAMVGLTVAAAQDDMAVVHFALVVVRSATIGRQQEKTVADTLKHDLPYSSQFPRIWSSNLMSTTSTQLPSSPTSTSRPAVSRTSDTWSCHPRPLLQPLRSLARPRLGDVAVICPRIPHHL